MNHAIRFCNVIVARILAFLSVDTLARTITKRLGWIVNPVAPGVSSHDFLKSGIAEWSRMDCVSGINTH